MDLYPTLTNGGKLEVLPKETTDNFKQLFSRLPEMKVNTWVSTPSFADICLLSKEFDEKHLPDLKRFMFCGEELTHQTAQRLKERFPNAQVFNTYGPTEATVAVTQTEITDEVLENYQRLPIGVCKEDAKSFCWMKTAMKLKRKGRGNHDRRCRRFKGLFEQS